MIQRILRTYRDTGIRGIKAAIARRLHRKPTLSPMSLALDAIFDRGDFTIVQIGAYIGDSVNDPLFERVKRELKKNNGRLICVEPVKQHFDALVRNYAGTPGVSFENVAIADRTGEATFYRLGVDPIAHGYPEWLSQLGSLKKERMEALWDKHEAMDDVKAFYLRHRVEEIVQCLTFQDLLHRHGIASVDLLQMDTEGYELEILSTIDFRRIPIRFVNYECVLLHEHKEETQRLMRTNGYRLIDHGKDTLSFKASDTDFISRHAELGRQSR